MELKDYIAIMLLVRTRSEYWTNSEQEYVFSTDSASKCVGSQSFIEPENISIKEIREAFALIELWGIAEKFVTPHASARVVIDGKSASEALQNFGSSEGSLGSACIAYRKLGNDWLIESVRGCFAVYQAAALTAESSNENWVPFEVEANEGLHELTEKIDQLVEAVRQDNGYAETAPSERSEVLARLRGAAAYLRDAAKVTGSALEGLVALPLRQLQKHFPPKTLVGGIVKLAGEILKDWLKKHGVNGLDHWLG